MADINWSEAQQKVLSSFGKNLLVAAAAGSGKTAVLVERIIRIISDPRQPVDIDELLVVTFTNAAAAEMRNRIGKAIEEKLRGNPGDTHLQKQMSLLPGAHIMTIDSFCLYVIRNYFHQIDLDPSFRMADESELVLLKNKVSSDLMESYYEKSAAEGADDENADLAFLTLIDAYSSNRSDSAIEELILKLYDYSTSYPYPDVWLDECAKLYKDAEKSARERWLPLLQTYLHNMALGMQSTLASGLALAQGENGPDKYIPVFTQELEMLDALVKADTYEEYRSALLSIEFARLPSQRKNTCDEDIQARAKSARERVKKMVSELWDNYFYDDLEHIYGDLSSMAPLVEKLVEMVKSFRKNFAEAKAEKGILDFSDLEHLALQILSHHCPTPEDPMHNEPTDCAKELRDSFVEIMIDEYQDSNFVQEYILTSISREPVGQPNMFMVGDVKQSIYKFRQARPELFMEKYDTYPAWGNEAGDESPDMRIDLQENFRSKPEILYAINEIFFRIMQKSLGGIAYTKEAMLNPGKTTNQDSVTTDAELNSEETEKQSPETPAATVLLTLPDEGQSMDAIEAEARAIGQKIRTLSSTREYGDMVILLRTMSGWSETFVRIFEEMGIPAYAETRTGYFSSMEIQTILNFLRILDNPRQDIPLTAILRSEIIGMSDDELALLGSMHYGQELWDLIQCIASDERDPAIQEISSGHEKLFDTLCNHCIKLYNMLEHLRDKSDILSITDLLYELYDCSGYYQYCQAMPDGEKRTANLDMLIQKADGFSGGSCQGLFQFIRYLEKLHQYSVDYGEASTISDSMNAVKIMSIHKSKGLEFPVVFLAGCGKSFNFMDARAKFVLHPDLGIAMNQVNPQYRISKPTILKKLIARLSTLDTLGEELRILYVALTRAKEELFVSGFCKDESALSLQSGISYLELSSAKCYLDWLLPVVMDQDTRHWNVETVSAKDILCGELSRQLTGIEKKLSLESFDISREYSADVAKALAQAENYVYPYANQQKLPVKVSVSALKHLDEDDPVVSLISENAITENPSEDTDTTKAERNTPSSTFSTAQTNGVLSGADRGTAYHTVMEHFPYDKNPELSDHCHELLSMELDNMQNNHFLTPEERNVVKVRDLEKFMASPLYSRMKNAYTKNSLYREQPFVISMPAKDIYPETDSPEPVLIQGIIDAYFFEGDHIILVDYKTDRLKKGQTGDYLIQLYQKQLEYYAYALSSITGIPVTEKWIYSFTLGQALSCEE